MQNSRQNINSKKFLGVRKNKKSFWNNKISFWNRRLNYKSIRKKLIFVALWIAAWILFGFNTSNGDYANYENAYNNFAIGINDNYFEKGFALIIQLFVWLKFSYPAFLIVISAITLFIFTKSLNYLTNNRALTFLCFIIYPFAFDIVQYRNFLAFSIVLYGLHFLLKEKVAKEDIICYILAVLIASSIHSSMLIYMAFLFVLIGKIKQVAILFLTLFICVFIVIVKGLIPYNILTALGLDKFIRYDIDGSYSTFIQYFCVYAFWMALSLFKYYKVDRTKKLLTVNEQTTVATKTLKLLFICIFFLPFILMNGTSARFIRNTYVIFYSFLLTRNGKKTNKKNLWYFIIFVALLLTILFIFYEQLMSGLYYEIVLKPIFKYNLLW